MEKKREPVRIKIKKRETEKTSRILENLNEEQRRAVVDNSGPILIIAGAGTGKTRTITHKVAYLIEQGIAPSSIMLVTFTKKAAEEMVERIKELLGGEIQELVAGTFHHIANITLHKYGSTIGIKNDFSILDSDDQVNLMKIALNEIVPDKKERSKLPRPSELCKIYSLQINQAKVLAEVLNENYSRYLIEIEKIREIIDHFNRLKQKYNVLDFDGLMLYYLKFLQEPVSLPYKKKIRYIFVDEYQDVNAIQAKIIEELGTNAKCCAVVGDDAQAIYGFRGANYKYILNFPKMFPGTKEYKLELNYRSTPEILKLANAIIKHNKFQFPKNLRAFRKSLKESEEDVLFSHKPMLFEFDDNYSEAEGICSLILEFKEAGIPLRKQAVLFRSRYQSFVLETELIRLGIDYEVRAGRRFFERAHIKDLLALLSIIQNPRDGVQWIRVLSLHTGISDISARKIVSVLETQSDPLYFFTFSDLSNVLKGKRIKKEGIKDLQNLQAFFRETLFKGAPINYKKEEPKISFHELMEKAIDYIIKRLPSKYNNKANEKIKIEERKADLKEMETFTRKYETLEDFIIDISTQFDIFGQAGGQFTSGEEEGEEERDRLVISTIHQSKGLEWDVVFLIGMVKGRFPSSRSMATLEDLEEERRLFYVAATRARDYLILSHYTLAETQFINQATGNSVKVLSGRSLFLEEIEDDDVYELIELEYEYE